MKQRLNQLTELRTHQFCQTLAGLEEQPPTEENLRELCWILEKFMRGLRELQIDLTSSRYSTDQAYGAALPPVAISKEGGIYSLRFQTILPLKTKSRCDLLCEDLEYAITSYVDEHRLRTPVFDKAVVVFCHHYRSGGSPTRKLRDYDNLERKSILDALVPFFLPDDNPRCMRSFDFMAGGKTDFTQLLLMDWASFQGYIARLPALF